MEDILKVTLQEPRYYFSHDLVFILACLESAYRLSGIGDTKKVSNLSQHVVKITSLPYFNESVPPYLRDRMGLFSGLEKSRDNIGGDEPQDSERMSRIPRVHTENSLAIGKLSLDLRSCSSLRSLEVNQKQHKLPLDGELPYPLLVYCFDFLTTFSDIPYEGWR